MIAIGVDVGGTKIAGVRAGRDGEILGEHEVASPAQEPDAIVEAIVAMVGWLRDRDVSAVGVGAAGMVEAATGIMRYAPNLAWRDLPLRDRVAEGCGLPTLLDNDANLAAWGEYRFGAGRGTDHMLAVTVGTGIGGGIVVGGRLVRGAHGFAGEIGHVIVDPAGPLCGCGNHGCWEQLASGRAIDRLGREAVARHPHGALARMVNGAVDTVSGPLVTAAARDGDEEAVGILAEVGRRLGEGIAGLVNVLDPEVVVVGGGAIEAGDLLLDPAREAYAEAVEGVQHRPHVPVLAAELGNDAGAIGAADLALLELGG